MIAVINTVPLSLVIMVIYISDSLDLQPEEGYKD